VAGLTLAMDAATGAGTIAVFRDRMLVHECTVEMRSADEERFFPAVLDALRAAGGSVADLDRIVCGAGPGSFTALRVVGAIAKGLAVGGRVPLFAVPSLALIVAADDRATSGVWLAALDALRGDKYIARIELEATGAVRAVEYLGLAAAAELRERAATAKATLIGPDETHRALPHARGLARCWDLALTSGPVVVDSWEPLYGRLAEAQAKWEATAGQALRSTRSDA
jgi:tRNA threonylcarbamoyladenosine biosynthesis protein TsaB